MSRTKKGSKAPGYDYWTRRNKGSMVAGYGPDVKHVTHKRERQESKQIVAVTGEEEDLAGQWDGYWDEDWEV